MTNQNIIIAASLMGLFILIWLYFKIKNKSKIKKLEAQIKQLERDLNDADSHLEQKQSVPDFLNEHKELAKNRYKKLANKNVFEFSPQDPIEVQVALFRAYYLKAEMGALKWVEDNDKYWLVLDKGLQQIFSNFGTQKVIKALHLKSRTIESLEKKLALLSDNDQLSDDPDVVFNKITNCSKNINKSISETIKHNSAKKELIDQLNISKNGSVDTDHVVDSIKNSINDSNDDANNLKSKISALIKEIEFLKNLKSKAETDGYEGTDSSFDDFNSKNERNKDQTLQQIKLLRNNNDQQRSFIIKLRNEISNLEKENNLSHDLPSEEAQKNVAEIENLEHMITEFEHCIFALESEVDLLHSQFGELEKCGSSSKNTIQPQKDDSSSALMNQTSIQLKETTQLYSDQKFLNDLATKTNECAKVIDLLMVINNSFTSLGINCAFYIKTEISHNKSIPDGFINKAEEELLEAKEMSVRGEQFPLGNKMFFWDKYFSMIVGTFPDDLERKKQLIDKMSSMKKIISNDVKRIEFTLINARHNKTLMRLLNATQKELSDIDIQQNYQNSEYSNILDSVFNQIHQLESLKNLTPEANMIVHNLLEELKIRAELMKNCNSLVSSGFKNLIGGLEKKINT